MQYPLVSTFILVYKKYVYLYDTLTSIMDQDYPNIELIVSDDGSGNFPYDEIRSFIEMNKKGNIKNLIININEVNQGTVKHFNNVIKMCSGEYLIGAASDDSFSNKFIISRIVNEFQSTNALCITARRRVYLKNGKAGDLLPTNKMMSLISKLQPVELYKLLTGINFISGACTYYSKSIFDEYGYYDEKYVLLDDYPRYLSLLRRGMKIHQLDLETIHYNVGGVSTAGNLHPQLYKDAILAIESEIIPFMFGFNFFEKRRVYYQYYYFKRWKDMNCFQRICFKLKYIDAVLYRLKFI